MDFNLDEKFNKIYYGFLKEYNDNCCIIFYLIINSYKFVYKIYKNLEDFKNKAKTDIQNTDSIYGISFQIWYYD